MDKGRERGQVNLSKPSSIRDAVSEFRPRAKVRQGAPRKGFFHLAY
jgi:hypothetical protein